MTILTTADICKMTAEIIGGEVKRAATKEAAITRLRKIAADKGLDADAILSGVQPEPEAEAAPAAVVPGKSRRAAIAIIEAEAPAPVIATRKARAAKVKADKPAKGPTKREIMLDMVRRTEGATEQDICEEIGWKACLVTLRRAAEAEGVTLRAEKNKGEKSRYFGTRAA